MRTGASHLESGYIGFVEERTDRPGGAGAFALGREVEQSTACQLFWRKPNGGQGITSPDQGESRIGGFARTASRYSREGIDYFLERLSKSLASPALSSFFFAS